MSEPLDPMDVAAERIRRARRSTAWPAWAEGRFASGQRLYPGTPRVARPFAGVPVVEVIGPEGDDVLGIVVVAGGDLEFGQLITVEFSEVADGE